MYLLVRVDDAEEERLLELIDLVEDEFGFELVK